MGYYTRPGVVAADFRLVEVYEGFALLATHALILASISWLISRFCSKFCSFVLLMTLPLLYDQTVCFEGPRPVYIYDSVPYTSSYLIS